MRLWDHVQSTSTFVDATGTTIPLAFGSDVTAGNLLICSFTWGNSSETPTLSDSRGNVWEQINLTCRDTVDNQSFALFWTVAGSSGPCTVTGGWGGVSHQWRRIAVSELFAVGYPVGLDRSARTQNGSCNTQADNARTPVLTPGLDGELIFGCFCSTVSSNPVTPGGTGFLELVETSAGTGAEIEHEIKVLPVAAAVQATWTATNSTSHMQCYIAYFRGSVPGPSNQ